MARFQALTNAVLDQELDDVRRHLGLKPTQKADLLREVTSLAAWVVRQAEAGRRVEARWGREAEPLVHPALQRLQSKHVGSKSSFAPLVLSDDEVVRLSRVLERGLEPTPALADALARLAGTKPRPSPRLRWAKGTRARGGARASR